MSHACCTFSNSKGEYYKYFGYDSKEEVQLESRWNIRLVNVLPSEPNKSISAIVEILNEDGHYLAPLSITDKALSIKTYPGFTNRSQWKIEESKQTGKFTIMPYKPHKPHERPDEYNSFALNAISDRDVRLYKPLQEHKQNHLWYIKKDNDRYAIINCEIPVELSSQTNRKVDSLNRRLWIADEKNRYKRSSGQAQGYETVEYDPNKKELRPIKNHQPTSREDSSSGWEIQGVGPTQDFPIKTLRSLVDPQNNVDAMQLALKVAEAVDEQKALRNEINKLLQANKRPRDTFEDEKDPGPPNQKARVDSAKVPTYS